MFVGGHSKGGNLAVYGAALCEKEIQDKIIKIYRKAHAPGFSEEFLESEGLQRIFSKIERYITEGSIIGTLLAHKKSRFSSKAARKV